MPDDKRHSIPDLASLVDSVEPDGRGDAPDDQRTSMYNHAVGAEAAAASQSSAAHSSAPETGRDIGALIEADIGGQAHPTVARRALTDGMLESLKSIPRPRAAPAPAPLQDEPPAPRELEVPEEEKQTGLFLPVERPTPEDRAAEPPQLELSDGTIDGDAAQALPPRGVEPLAEGEARTNMYLPAVKAQKFIAAEQAKRSWIARHGLKLALVVAACGALGGGGYGLYRAVSKTPATAARGDGALGARASDGGVAPRRVTDGSAGVVGRFMADASTVAAGSGQTLRFEKRGSRIVVPVTLALGKRRLSVKMLFDTGATLTTLAPATLARLGVKMAGDEPTVALRTASGVVKAPLTVLDSIAVGKVHATGGLAVSVCDSCASAGIAGLLGLNVTRHFAVTIDHESGTVALQAKTSALGHLYDVRPFVTLDKASSGRHGERLVIDVEVTNRAPRAIRQLVLVAKERDGAKVAEVARGVVRQLGPGQTQRARLRGRSRKARSRFTVSIAGAEW